MSLDSSDKTAERHSIIPPLLRDSLAAVTLSIVLSSRTQAATVSSADSSASKPTAQENMETNEVSLGDFLNKLVEEKRLTEIQSQLIKNDAALLEQINNKLTTLIKEWTEDTGKPAKERMAALNSEKYRLLKGRIGTFKKYLKVLQSLPPSEVVGEEIEKAQNNIKWLKSITEETN